MKGGIKNANFPSKKPNVVEFCRRAREKRYPHNQFRFALPYVMEKEFVAVLYS